MRSRTDLPYTYTEYQDLVDQVYAAALQKGLAFQNPVTVTLSVGGSVLGSSIPTPDAIEVLVTADEQPLPYYYQDTLWLQMLPGSRFYRVFRVSMADKPDDEDWWPLTSAAEVIDPRLRRAQVEYIQQYVASHGGGGGGGNLNVARFTVGNGLAQTFTLAHNFGTRDISVTCFESSSGNEVEPGVVRLDSNSVRIDFTFPISANSHRVLVTDLSPA